MRITRLLTLTTLAVVAVGAQAVTFTLVQFTGSTTTGASTLASGYGFIPSGNAVSITAPNAKVGDGEPIRNGQINVIYDVNNMIPLFAINMTLNLQGFLRGTGELSAVEDVFELDAHGNEIGGPIATIMTPVLTSAFPNISWSATRVFSRHVTHLRAKKTITLTAMPDIPSQLDYAQLGIVNQSFEIVPEPATLAAVGIGLASLAARRRRK